MLRARFTLAVLVLAAPVVGIGSLPVASATAVSDFCGGQADPDVLLCDDFEDRNVSQLWDVASRSNSWPNADFVVCADGFGFGDRCAAWSNRLIFDTFWGFWGYDAWRRFSPRQEFYVRWYQYISDPYTWGTLEDKSVVLHDEAKTITAYVSSSRNELPAVAASGPGKPFVANYQDVDWEESGGAYTKINRFQNQGNDIMLVPGKWYLFEWFVKLNTPGVSDGVTRLWVDDASQAISVQTLRLQHLDMRWLKAGDSGKQFAFLRLTVYHQRCDATPNTCPPNGPMILNQSQRWDHLVVSTRPVGPIALPPLCGAAHPIPEVLWPPNHRLVPVTIGGVTDPHGYAVAITILNVSGEEPSDGRRDQPRRIHRRDDSTSDVVIRGDTAWLRAERDGRGSGRHYDVDFVARNSLGFECTGTVRVRVPHDRGHGKK